MNATNEEKKNVNEGLAADLGLFAAYLFGAFAIIGIGIGIFIISHVCYMKFFKKP